MNCAYISFKNSRKIILCTFLLATVIVSVSLLSTSDNDAVSSSGTFNDGGIV